MAVSLPQFVSNFETLLAYSVVSVSRPPLRSRRQPHTFDKCSCDNCRTNQTEGATCRCALWVAVRDGNALGREALTQSHFR